MNLLERIAFKLLRKQGWQLRELSDSWQDALISREVPDQHRFFRMLNTAMKEDVLHQKIHDHRIDLVIDVGANRGSFAQSLRRIGYTDDILSLEANPSVFQELESAANFDPAWHVEQIAIGQIKSKMKLYLTVDDSFASSHKPNECSLKVFGDISKVVSSVTVDVIPLNVAIERLERKCGKSYDRIMLKTDTQGMDREVVRSAGSVINRVQVLLTEMSIKPIYEQIPSFEEFYKECLDSGYELVHIIPVSWGRSFELIEIDCLFQRTVPEKS